MQKIILAYFRSCIWCRCIFRNVDRIICSRFISFFTGFIGYGKGLIERVAEIGFGAGTAYGINKFIFKNNTYIESITNKLITITAAEIAGE